MKRQMTDVETYTEKAARRGARLLDSQVPRWYTYVDIDTLDMSAPRQCVCGQLVEVLRSHESAAVTNWSQLFMHVYRASRRRRRLTTTTIGDFFAVVGDLMGRDLMGRDEPIVRHGFTLNMSAIEDWEDLTRAWRREIRARRG